MKKKHGGKENDEMEVCKMMEGGKNAMLKYQMKTQTIKIKFSKKPWKD